MANRAAPTPLGLTPRLVRHGRLSPHECVSGYQASA